MRGITVCVEYDDLLEITLVRNMRHLEECVVVTSPQDTMTQELVHRVPGCQLHVTDAFYRGGAKFNKGLAIEEGFSAMGRHGQILIWDADILLPDVVTLPTLSPDCLYGASRRILDNPKTWAPGFNWDRAWLSRESCFPGYFQLFNAEDHHIRQLPWYDVTFSHAGGGDGYFQSRWPDDKKIRLPFSVLHLGPRDVNWFGRGTERIDGQPVENRHENRKTMQDFLCHKGWGPRQNRRVPVFDERVQVEGHQPSGFELKKKE